MATPKSKKVRTPRAQQKLPQARTIFGSMLATLVAGNLTPKQFRKDLIAEVESKTGASHSVASTYYHKLKEEAINNGDATPAQLNVNGKRTFNVDPEVSWVIVNNKGTAIGQAPSRAKGNAARDADKGQRVMKTADYLAKQEATSE